MRYFSFDEFDSPDSPGSGERYMDREFLEMLDEARHISGLQFKINSGYRSQSHNRKVKGVSTSSHLVGRAADIACVHANKRYKIVASLLEVGFTRIGISKSFIHVDNDDLDHGGLKKDAIWTY